jgi:hypothetical protein
MVMRDLPCPDIFFSTVSPREAGFWLAATRPGLRWLLSLILLLVCTVLLGLGALWQWSQSGAGSNVVTPDMVHLSSRNMSLLVVWFSVLMALGLLAGIYLFIRSDRVRENIGL